MRRKWYLHGPPFTFEGQPTTDLDDDDPYFNTHPALTAVEAAAVGDDPIVVRHTRMWKQREFHLDVIDWAYSFLNVPYAYGGQTYGGRQSENWDDYTCGHSADARHAYHAERGPTILAGASQNHPGGYGIDCSGLIVETALRMGITQAAGAGQGLTAGDLRSTPLAWPAPELDAQGHILPGGISWSLLRPGDLIASGGHVAYVNGTAIIDPSTHQFGGIPTIEAHPNAPGTNGKPGVVRAGTRSMSIDDDRDFLNGVVRRRWIAP